MYVNVIFVILFIIVTLLCFFYLGYVIYKEEKVKNEYFNTEKYKLKIKIRTLDDFLRDNKNVDENYRKCLQNKISELQERYIQLEKEDSDKIAKEFIKENGIDELELKYYVKSGN